MREQRRVRITVRVLLALVLCVVTAGCASSAARVPQCTGRAVPINAVPSAAGQVSHAHGA